MIVKGILTPDATRGWRSSTAPREWSSQTTAAASSTRCCPAPTRCRRWSTRSATSSTCSSTAGSAAAPTCSRRSRSAPARCWSAGRCCAAWRVNGAAGAQRVLEILLEEFDAALKLAGAPAATTLDRSFVTRAPWARRRRGEDPRHRGHRLRRRRGRAARCCATDTTVTGFARDPGRLTLEIPVVQGDAVTGAGSSEALAGVEVAYYLIHSMEAGDAQPFRQLERRRGRAVRGARPRLPACRRIVYLGGLVPADGPASRHLASRAEVERDPARACPRHRSRCARRS